jgi:hypothetical protein
VDFINASPTDLKELEMIIDETKLDLFAKGLKGGYNYFNGSDIENKANENNNNNNNNSNNYCESSNCIEIRDTLYKDLNYNPNPKITEAEFSQVYQRMKGIVLFKGFL